MEDESLNETTRDYVAADTLLRSTAWKGDEGMVKFLWNEGSADITLQNKLE